MDSDCVALALPIGGVVWTAEGTPTILDPISYATLEFLDGATSLIELTEDVAYAWRVPLELAESHVLKAAQPFLRVGAHSPSVDAAARPHRVTTVNDDGTTTVETTITISTDRTEVGVVLHLPDGDRSVAELLPGDSCLGAKLRNGAEMAQVTFEWDGVPFSVRTDDDDVHQALLEHGGHSDVDDRGPVFAFALRPLDGVAPVRVYDATGRRVGRPRSTVAVLEAIEDAVSALLPRRSQVALLQVATLSRADRAVIIPRSILALPRLERAAGRLGLTVGWAPVEIVAATQLETAAQVEESRWEFSNGRRPRRQFCVSGALPYWNGKGSNQPIGLTIDLLLGDKRLPNRDERKMYLKKVVDIARRVPVVEWVADDVRGAGAADKFCALAADMLQSVSAVVGPTES